MMKNYLEENIEINQTNIVLRTIPIGGFSKVVLWSVILVSATLPVIVSIVFTILGEEIKQTIVITYILFWAICIYFLRILSWNTSGFEEIQFGKASISMSSKSKHFTFRKESIPNIEPVISTIPHGKKSIDGVEVLTSKIIVRSREDQIMSNIPLPQKVIDSKLGILNKKIRDYA
jgi:hypothetical protein